MNFLRKFYDYILALVFLLFGASLFLSLGEIAKIIPMVDGYESVNASFYELKGCKDKVCVGIYKYTVGDKEYFINENDVYETNYSESIKIIYDKDNPENNLKDGLANSISFCVVSIVLTFLFLKATIKLLKNRKEVRIPTVAIKNEMINNTMNNKNVKVARAGIKIIRVIFYLIFYPFIIVGLIILMFIYIDYRMNSVEVKAYFDKVVYCETGLNSTCNVKYKFDVDGKTYYIEEMFDKDNHTDTIDIEYYKKQPEFAMLYSGDDKVLDGFLLFTLITVDLLFIVSFVSKFDKIKVLIYIIKNKKEERGI